MDWQTFTTGISRFAGDLSSYASLEQAPDLVAWCVCGSLAIWMIRKSVLRRPKLCLASLFAWLCWFTCEVAANPKEALSGMKSRGLIALEATEQFFLQGVLFLKAWSDFFLPFLSSVTRSIVRNWQKLSREEQQIVVGAVIIVIVLYGVWQVLLFAYRRARKRVDESIAYVKRKSSGLTGAKARVLDIFKQLVLLLTVPLMWYAWDYVPSERYIMLAAFWITYMPALVSMQAIANDNLERQRAWLSYWSCWPFLASLLALLSYSEGHLSSAMPDVDVNKVFLTFVTWLQFSGCSEYLSLMLQRLSAMLNFDFSILFRWFPFSMSSKSSTSAGLFGQIVTMIPGLGGGGAANGGSGVVSISGLMRFCSIMGGLKSLGRKLGLVAVALIAVACLVLVWRVVAVFYTAVSTLVWLVELAVYLFAASDAAETLRKNDKDYYTKKLSFWVMAIVWKVFLLLCGRVPLIGGAPSLFTPVTHAIWSMAGDKVLRLAVLPLCRKLLLPLRMILCSLSGTGQARAPSGNAGLAPVALQQNAANDAVIDPVGDRTRTPPTPEGDTGSQHRPENDAPEDSSNDHIVTGDTGGEPGQIGEGATLSAPTVASNGDAVQEGAVSSCGADTGGTGVLANEGDGVSTKGELRSRKKGKNQ